MKRKYNAPRENSWQRPPVPPLDPEKPLQFQQLEIDYTTGDPIEGMPGLQLGQVAIIRMWGITAIGASVQCNVHGFTPYLYVRAPPGFRENDCENFRETLNYAVGAAVTNQGRSSIYISKVSLVMRESIMGFQLDDARRPFLMIVTSHPKYVPVCRTTLQQGINFMVSETSDFVVSETSYIQFQTFESNLPFVLRFMIDLGIGGGYWIEVDSFTQTDRSSACQYEVDVSYMNVHPLPLEGEFSGMSPMRVLSFDIECAGRKGTFPDPKHDPVIQIANSITIQGESQPCIRNVFNLHSCDPIPGADVLVFETESELLLEWARFVRECDPDIIIGYNICNFDLPYLFNRAKNLHLSDLFLSICKVRDETARMKETTFTSKAYGTHKSTEATISGRVIMDIIQIIQRDHKLSSYSLNAVSARFLSEQKEDVHHSNITDLFNGTSQDRKRLAVYCLKDAYLPQRLFEKLLILYNQMELARVTGVPLSYLLSRGQSIKVVSQIYRRAGRDGLVIPYYEVKKKDDNGKKAYEGAIVINPLRGFYSTPIVTLDFASLYPSIMLAHNLSYDTLLNSIPEGFVEGEDYEKTPDPEGKYFVKPKHRQGILTLILSDLLNARKRARAELAKTTDRLQRACLDGRQLALKISANSVYGFTGAEIGKLPCIAISASVTAYGRDMIMLTKKSVEEHYCIANGYPSDTRVVYGDTDSVMINFRDIELSKAMELGKEAAGYVTSKFVTPIRLEFEKAYFPYLLVSKKRYAGLLWTKPEKWDKIDQRGLESVRRDNCGMVRELILQVLEEVLVHRNIPKAVEMSKFVISELLQNKTDMSKLVITKGYTKEDYKGKQPHVELVKRMRERDPLTAPGVGDRVPFVVVKSRKDAKLFEKAEDPLWVLEHNIPLDTRYYLENQLKKPLTRIFRALLPDPNVLFVGEHTRTISNPTPKKGGIMGFVQNTKRCVGCRTPLVDESFVTCLACRPKEADYCIRQCEKTRQAEYDFARLWTQCQACQGSLYQTVLCNNRDCAIFYRRKKVQMDVEDATKALNEFPDLEW